MAESRIYTENPSNSSMHYGDFTVGRINPPDYIPKYRLYSYAEGEQRYNEIQHDLYVGAKKAKPKRKSGFPLVLKISGGCAILCGLVVAALKLRK